MPRTVYRVLPDRDRWVVWGDGAKKPAKRFSLKDVAIVYARGLARSHEPSQLVIYERDGTIQREFTYGADPYLPAG